MNMVLHEPVSELLEVGVGNMQTHNMRPIGNVLDPESVVIIKELKQGFRFSPGAAIRLDEVIDKSLRHGVG